ncbi:MAG: hypothetical protein JNJ61_29945, partial [Anaerolineae bacterium]|nr:hypothetical protein [Anaerolineae bacterium]
MQSILHRTISIPSYFAAPVFVEAVEAEDDGSYFLRLRTDTGQLVEVNLTAEEFEAALDSVQSSAAVTVSAQHQSLVVETERIRLAYAY